MNTELIPAVSSPISLTDMLPHMLLPVVVIGGYFLPPFRGRAAVFLVLLSLTQWRCAVSSWPPNMGNTRAMRYGLATSWIFVLPAVERLVMRTPEKDIWREDASEEEADSQRGGGETISTGARDMSTSVSTSVSTSTTTSTTTTTTAHNTTRRNQNTPPFAQNQASKVGADPAPASRQAQQVPIPEWSLHKLLSALRLLATPRAVGYNISSRSVKAARGKIRQARKSGAVSRMRFITQRAVTSALCYLVWDGIMVAWQRIAVVPDAWAWDGQTLRDIAAAEALMLATVYCGMTMQFESAAAIAVGLSISEMEDWPPAFGSILDCYTIANVWGKFWHQYIRQPCLGFSHALLQALHIPRHSTLAYLVHLTTAFFISALCHILAVGTVAPGFYPLRTLASDMLIFFMLQPIGTMMESTAIALFNRLVWAPSTFNMKSQTRTNTNARPSHDQDGDGDARNMNLVTEVLPNTRRDDDDELQSLIIRPLCRVAGYMWVLCWFHVTSWPFIKAYAGVRMQDWQVPYSVVGRLLELCQR